MNAKQIKKEVRKKIKEAVANGDSNIELEFSECKLTTIMAILTSTLNHNPKGTFEIIDNTWKLKIER